jgi:rare lipoprotein A (peptidoglycan hydrolase)
MKQLLMILLVFLLCSATSSYNNTTGVLYNNKLLLDTVPVNEKDTVIIRKDTLASDSIHTDTITVVVDSNAVAFKGKVVHGIASFYSTSLEGTKTSTGEIYRHHKMTAASNHFKLNTWVRVTNLKNGKSVEVRINDHMHKKMQKKGRVIDLSRTAAKQLDFMKKGLTNVKVEEIPAPSVK